MDLKVKLSIVDGKDNPFMGIGLVWLLDGVARLGSIRRAAAEMDLSYVKALKMIRRLEEGLGAKVIVRERGGKSGGGASLTPLGERFIRDYDLFQRAVKRSARNEFRTIRSRYGRKKGENKP